MPRKSEIRNKDVKLSAHERTLAAAIDRVFAISGGPSALARTIGISRATVSAWHRRIPERHVLDVEGATGIPREELRPDLYGPAKERKEIHKPNRFKSRVERLAHRRAVL